MSRFREEHYATRAHKAFTRREKRAKAALEADKGESRAFYFSKPLPVRKAIRKAQAQARLDGF